jgi:hypothetical protein
MGTDIRFLVRREVIRWKGVICREVGATRRGVIRDLGVTRLQGVIHLLGATRILELILLLAQGPLRMGHGRSARCRATHGADRRLLSQLRLCHLVVRQTRNRLVISTTPLQLGVWTRITLLPMHPQRRPTRLSPPPSPHLSRTIALLRCAQRNIALPKYVLIRSIARLICVRRSMSRRTCACRMSRRRRIMSLRSCVSLLQAASVLRRALWHRLLRRWGRYLLTLEASMVSAIPLLSRCHLRLVAFLYRFIALQYRFAVLL